VEISSADFELFQEFLKFKQLRSLDQGPDRETSEDGPRIPLVPLPAARPGELVDAWHSLQQVIAAKEGEIKQLRDKLSKLAETLAQDYGINVQGMSIINNPGPTARRILPQRRGAIGPQSEPQPKPQDAGGPPEYIPESVDEERLLQTPSDPQALSSVEANLPIQRPLSDEEVAAREGIKSSAQIARDVELLRKGSGLTDAELEAGFAQQVALQLQKTIEWNAKRKVE
jgi:hypothetical protein